MNPYVFLVGCPRSGTTLLGRIADAHPQLAITHETRWIARAFERREGLTLDGLVTADLAERLDHPKILKPLGMDGSELRVIAGSHVGQPFAAFGSALFDRVGELRGASHVGDKSPGYVRYLPTLHGIWPHARFVHIIRDGRAVALSVLEWGKGASSFRSFEHDPITTIAVWWEWYVRLGREGAVTVGREQALELRYEELVEEPEPSARRLGTFLGLPFDPAMLRFHEGRTDRRPGLSTKSAWLPVTAGLRDWRSGMDAEARTRFEAAAGDLLDELGYPRTVAAIPSDARERADRVREDFVAQLVTRERPIPSAWRSPARRVA